MTLTGVTGSGYTIECPEVNIGRGVVIEDGVYIKADRLRIGDYAFLGRGSRYIAPLLSIGDYTRVNADTFAGGTLALTLGHGCYIGGKVRLDSRGGLRIGNNVGIGDHSQVWTHIMHGSLVDGCRFNAAYPLEIEDDAWLVGHVLVGGARKIGARAMAMLGSVITRDLDADCIYAGVPAHNVTDKLGSQFARRSTLEKFAALSGEIAHFEAQHPEWRGQLVPVMNTRDFENDGRTYFDVSTRRYTKRHSAAEVAFMRLGVYKPLPYHE